MPVVACKDTLHFILHKKCNNSLSPVLHNLQTTTETSDLPVKGNEKCLRLVETLCYIICNRDASFYFHQGISSTENEQQSRQLSW